MLVKCIYKLWGLVWLKYRQIAGIATFMLPFLSWKQNKLKKWDETDVPFVFILYLTSEIAPCVEEASLGQLVILSVRWQHLNWQVCHYLVYNLFFFFSLRAYILGTEVTLKMSLLWAFSYSFVRSMLVTTKQDWRLNLHELVSYT